MSMEDTLHFILELLKIRMFGYYGSYARGISTAKTNEIDANILIGGFSLGKYLVRGRFGAWDVHFTMLKVPPDVDFWVAYPTVGQEPLLSVGMVLAFHSRILDARWKDVVASIVDQVPREDRRAIAEHLLYLSLEFLRTASRPKDLTRAICDFFPYGIKWLEDPDDIPSLYQREPRDFAVSDEHLDLMLECVARKAEGVFDRELARRCLEFVEGEILKRGLSTSQLRRSHEYVMRRLEPHRVTFYRPIEVTDPPRVPEADFLIGLDFHDVDIAVIDEEAEEPYIIQREEEGVRVDEIHVPPDLGCGDVIRGGKPAYQPLSYILLCSATPLTRRAERLLERLEHCITPRRVAEYYVRLARWFLWGGAPEELDIDRKCWRVRRETAKSIAKMAVPLHRVGRDLLPRAIYMLERNEFPKSHEPPSISVGYDMVYNEVTLAFLERNDVKSLDKVARFLEEQVRELSEMLGV